MFKIADFPQNARMFSWNRLSAGVKALFFVQIINRMGDFVVPFLTLILTQVQGFSLPLAGLVVTLATALGSLGGLVAGHLSDRYGRRDILVVFLGTSGTLLVAVGFAPAHLVSAVAMVAAGFFVGAMRPVISALVADLSEESTRRAAFSLIYLGINLGVSIGPVAAGWLFEHALSWMFWIDGLSTAVALLVLVRFVPRKTGPRAAAEPAPAPKGTLSAFLRHRVLLPFSLLFLVYELVYGQMIFTQSIQLVELFGARGPSVFGLVWAVNAVTCLVLTPVVLRLTKGWTNLASMTCSMIFVAAGLSVFLFHPGIPLLVASAVVWTTGEVLFSVHLGDFVTAQSPGEARGSFQAYSAFVGSLGFALAPAAGGLVVQFLGLAGLWSLSIGASLAAGLGFLLLNRRTSVR